MLRRTFVGALFARRELEQLDLFHQGDGSVHTYRIPALAETRRGTLLAVADARHEGTGDLPGRISLVMRTSSDKGKTWAAARTIREVKEGGVGDASLLVDARTGRVWCFFAYGPQGIGFRTAKAGERTGAHTLQVHAMYSDDDGVGWSAGVDLTAQIKEPQWQAMFATSGSHFQLRSGRYLLPCVVRDERGAVTARNAYSDDGGEDVANGAGDRSRFGREQGGGDRRRGGVAEHAEREGAEADCCVVEGRRGDLRVGGDAVGGSAVQRRDREGEAGRVVVYGCGERAA
ncbi:MAG: exo-alpha-sialidase [Acidobacteria bacterium]|nr:exo-alpha-sialidase [Acidobacteriota bacterium]